MFQLILADDKKTIAQVIQQAVDWNSLGVEVNCFYNGRDALEYICNNHVDMLVTDIKMPFLDGIELIRRVSQRYPEIKYVILTGYDEFTYARDALQLGVSEYLSKPVSIEKLRDLVLKLKDDAEQEQLRKSNYALLRKSLQKGLPLLRKEFFKQLLIGKFGNDEKLSDEIDNLGLDLDIHNFGVIIIEIDGISRNNESGYDDNQWMLFAVENIAQEQIQKHFKCAVFELEENRLAVLLNYASSISLRANQFQLYQVVKETQDYIKLYLDFSVSFGIGEWYQTSDKISSSFSEAMQALEQKLYYGNESIIYYSDKEEMELHSGKYPTDLEEKILKQVRFGRQQGLKELILLFTDELRTMHKYSASLIHDELTRFVMLLFGAGSVGRNRLAPLLKEFHALNTLDQMQAWLIEYTYMLTGQIDRESKNIKDDILKVKKYMEDHYDETITLKKMAEFIYISPPYLSFMFKEIVGVNFNEFLINVRIENAKILLEDSDYKVYEVCAMVGYNDKKYFSDLFKKHTGYLPKDWAKK